MASRLSAFLCSLVVRGGSRSRSASCSGEKDESGSLDVLRNEVEEVVRSEAMEKTDAVGELDLLRSLRGAWDCEEAAV